MIPDPRFKSVHFLVTKASYACVSVSNQYPPTVPTAQRPFPSIWRFDFPFATSDVSYPDFQDTDSQLSVPIVSGIAAPARWDPTNVNRTIVGKTDDGTEARMGRKTTLVKANALAM